MEWEDDNERGSKAEEGGKWTTRSLLWFKGMASGVLGKGHGKDHGLKRIEGKVNGAKQHHNGHLGECRFSPAGP